jgi:hypothetical protein
MARRSLDLIEAMRVIAEAAQPITGRGVGYKLFTKALITSIAKSEMQRVYRLLLVARERGVIPWEWIVDENRDLERCATWEDLADYARCVAQSYRRDFWDQQPVSVEVWSEKGTVRGVLAPILEHYAVGFRVLHGFSGATTIYDVAQDYDGRDLIVLYVRDFDPSGSYMSEADLPARFEPLRRIVETSPGRGEIICHTNMEVISEFSRPKLTKLQAAGPQGTVLASTWSASPPKPSAICATGCNNLTRTS